MWGKQNLRSTLGSQGVQFSGRKNHGVSALRYNDSDRSCDHDKMCHDQTKSACEMLDESSWTWNGIMNEIGSMLEHVPQIIGLHDVIPKQHDKQHDHETACEQHDGGSMTGWYPYEMSPCEHELMSKCECLRAYQVDMCAPC